MVVKGWSNALWVSGRVELAETERSKHGQSRWT